MRVRLPKIQHLTFFVNTSHFSVVCCGPFTKGLSGLYSKDQSWHSCAIVRVHCSLSGPKLTFRWMQSNLGQCWSRALEIYLTSRLTVTPYLISLKLYFLIHQIAVYVCMSINWLLGLHCCKELHSKRVLLAVNCFETFRGSEWGY